MPSTPIFAPKRLSSGSVSANSQADDNESDAKSEVDEAKTGEVLSVKTLANMFDFKSVNHVPTFKASAAKLEDNRIFQKAAKMLDENVGEEINQSEPSTQELRLE